MRTKSMGVLVALTLALGACDHAATGPEERATMRVGVRGDDGGARADRVGTGSTPGGTGDAAPGSGARDLTGSAEGSVDVTARVYVRSDAGGWVELTDGPQQATVDASGSAGAELLGSARLAAGSYTRVRVEFERVRARLSGTLQLDTGLLDGSVAVDLGGDGKVVVEREIAVRAGAGATTELDVALNPSAWLDRADTRAHTVAESSFASAVSVRSR